jgi:hypothetical protein
MADDAITSPRRCGPAGTETRLLTISSHHHSNVDSPVILASSLNQCLHLTVLGLTLITKRHHVNHNVVLPQLLAELGERLGSVVQWRSNEDNDALTLVLVLAVL